jgi:hypothetical protein
MSGGPWLDAVHIIGIAGVVFALCALAGGLYIYFALRGKGFALRRKLRKLHMAAGATAVVLGLAHLVGRLLQLHLTPFHAEPPFLAGWALLLVATSGLLRNAQPAALQGVPWLLPWAHRVFVACALVMVVLHGGHEVSAFLGNHAH